MKESLNVFITFHLAPELVEKVRAADPRVEITYEPGLLGKPRYPSDQHGGPVERIPDEERRWLGHLSRAEVVFWEEPLPPESPLWDMPNVIISPHSASTADTENAKLTEIFVDNIHRYLEGKPMRNLLDKKALY